MCARPRHRGHENAVPEHGGELRVRQRQRPEAEVRRGVGHRAQHELDGVDHLVHQHIAELELTAVQQSR